MTIEATGRVEQSASRPVIVIERTLGAPVAEVWNTMVDPEEMNRWIGTWTGEPGAGKRVAFVMSAEGASEPEDVLIHGCDPPSHLDVESFQAGASWRLTVDLTETDGVTTLVFRQGVDLADEAASSYGPGWEYYLDRLRAVLEGTEFSAWDDYFPAQQAYWQEQLRQVASGKP
jgi:uncharacterized protein YndB with AHSA1/START domain